MNSEEARHCRFQNSFHNTYFSEILRKTKDLAICLARRSILLLSLASLFHLAFPQFLSQAPEVDGLSEETFQE